MRNHTTNIKNEVWRHIGQTNVLSSRKRCIYSRLVTKSRSQIHPINPKVYVNRVGSRYTEKPILAREFDFVFQVFNQLMLILWLGWLICKYVCMYVIKYVCKYVRLSSFHLYLRNHPLKLNKALMLIILPFVCSICLNMF